MDEKMVGPDLFPLDRLNFFSLDVQEMYIYIVILQTPTSHSLTVFQTLHSAYTFIRNDVKDKDFYCQSQDFVANEICDLSAMHAAIPIRIAWNADKSCVASICKAEVHDDHAVSIIHSLFDAIPCKKHHS